MERMDAELPLIVQKLFGHSVDTGCSSEHPKHSSLYHLFTKDSLQFASREPAVNVYTPPGGKFLAHEDGQTLTILVPLSSCREFQGGGTAFWSPDSRGHRVDGPGIVVRSSEVGTAILFVGHVTHAGLPVTEGERVVLVASFGPKRCAQ
mmetsp:Transcript_10433/g.14600  ORF Transcript_10433/g.14600 Transcript_10433/m.14600 type:complete len:149 (+) Transcript_10433:735-1181(+)